MNEKNGFRKYKRQTDTYESVEIRKSNFKEFVLPLAKPEVNNQGKRCMDCGVPFCHSACPINNKIPDFNKAITNDDWEEAYNILDSTNNFPEFTGRLCPAPCESACVLGINRDAVSIKTVEKHIIENAFKNGWVKRNTKINTTGKKIAIVGSGPAGLTAADQLNRSGHTVHVFERSDKIGGLLRYGIPDFKLEKSVIDRRIKLMTDAGIVFYPSLEVGVDIETNQLLDDYDALILCCGATVPRDLEIEGRSSKGIYQAMTFLEQNNKTVNGYEWQAKENIDVKGKRVIVIGGGDTGADCVGTANRLGASSVIQIELQAKPPLNRSNKSPWPLWSDQLRTSSSHEEGCERRWDINTHRFLETDGQLKGIELSRVQWIQEEGNRFFKELKDTREILDCDIVLLAIGFLHAQKIGPISDLKLELDTRGNVITQNYETSKKAVFACGDMRMGQSLIVWAIAEGRKVAEVVNGFLENSYSQVYNAKSYLSV